MSEENKEFNLEDLNWSELDTAMEELKNQPQVEISFPDEDLSKLLEELKNMPALETAFPDAELKRLLDEMSQPDSELNSLISGSEAELNKLLESLDDSQLLSSLNVEEAEIPKPNPNLTATDVAAWMLEHIQKNGFLYQQKAVHHIRRHFGARFIYRNENFNPAISRDVLKEFLAISLPTVVWNRRERFWRLRQSSDPVGYRMVDN